MDLNRKAAHARPRVIVITDISSMQSGVLEPDDTQSLIRFLLYSNEMEIEGLNICFPVFQQEAPVRVTASLEKARTQTHQD